MKHYPFIRFTVFFIIGILSSYYISNRLLIPILIIFILLVILLIFFRTNKILSNISIPIIIFGTIIYSQLLQKPLQDYPFINSRIKDVLVKGIVTDISLPKENYFEFNLTAAELAAFDTTFNFRMHLVCKLKREDAVDENFQLVPGDTVIVKGSIQKAREARNPYEFSYYDYLKEQGIAALIYIDNIQDVQLVGNSKFQFMNIVFNARLSIAKTLEELYSERTSALLRGLLLADRSGIDYETKESFINSGVIHVLAVSGLHVGYIALIFLFLFSRFNIYLKNILTLFGLLIFVLLTGSPPSVVRASIMAAVIILYNFSIREYNKYNALAIAAFLILAADPQQLFNPGFQLSFSAVLSIFIIYPMIQRKVTQLNIKSNFINYLLLFVGVSLSAQIGTLPFTLIYFNKLSVVALLANIVVIPLIGIILALGIVTLLVSSLSGLFAIYYATTNEFAADILFAIVNLTGQWKHSFIFIPQFSVYDTITFYTLCAVLMLLYRKLKSIHVKVMFVLIIVLNAVFYFRIDNNDLLPDNLLSVVMLDIGQGDSFLIKFPNGQTALIDAGNASFGFDNGDRIIKPLLEKLSIDKIDYGFVSHVDADHCKGFESLVTNHYIERIYKPDLDSTVTKDIEFELLLKNQTELIHHRKEILKFGNANFYVLTDRSIFPESFSDINEKSTVMKLVYGNTSFLFTGDAGKKVENDYTAIYGEFLKSDVLKAGHHGSNTSTNEKFFTAINPELVLISCGLNNKFKHPSIETIDLFEKFNNTVLRTDLHKAVILHSDGEKIWQNHWY